MCLDLAKQKAHSRVVIILATMKPLVAAGNSRRPPPVPFSHYYSYHLIRCCLNTRRSYFPSCLFPLLTAISLVPLYSCRQGAVPIFSIKIIKMMRLEERHRCTLSRAERWSLISFSSPVLSSAPFHPSSNTFNCSFHVVLFGNWDWSTGNLNGNLVLKIIIIKKRNQPTKTHFVSACRLDTYSTASI